MERRIFRLLERKTILTVRDSDNLADYFMDFLGYVRGLDSVLGDFLYVVSGGSQGGPT
jgi:hypothetical protein